MYADYVKRANTLRFDLSHTMKSGVTNLSQLQGSDHTHVIDPNGAVSRSYENATNVVVLVMAGQANHEHQISEEIRDYYDISAEQWAAIRTIVQTFGKYRKYEGTVIKGNNEKLYSFARDIFNDAKG